MNKRIAPLVAILATLSFLASCKSSGKEETKAAPKQQRNAMQVAMTANLQRLVTFGEPRPEQVAESVHVAGRVEADATRLARLGSPVTGRITKFTAREGQHVQEGEILATLYTTQLSEAQFTFLKAYSQEQLAKGSTTRAEQLLKADVIGSAELARRRAELTQANAEVSASKDQLHILGMSDDEITKLQTAGAVNSKFHILASIGGTVLERNVSVGQIVQPADTVFQIADLSEVWLVADVPEQVAGGLAVGKRVQAEISVFPGEIVTGKLSFVSATVNPETRTVRVHMDLPNRSQRYKPNMLATMTVQDAARKMNVLPNSALVREDNEDYVFVQASQDACILRRVTLGVESGENRVLVSGLQPGEKIVLTGAFHLNNERKQRLMQGGS